MVAAKLQLILWSRTRTYSQKWHYFAPYSEINKQVDNTTLQPWQQRSVLHSGDMPQKHLNDFRGDVCGLLVELFDFGSRLFLKTLDVGTGVTAAL
jgi:hypothetical protein